MLDSTRRCIKECIVYLVFVIVVYFISYQERDFRSFLFAQNVKNQFFHGKPSFTSVSSRYISTNPGLWKMN